ncbi:MAG TPA: lysophospholipid acyltransferase family protein [Polyangiaceae bacterium]|nr:lysophospholipid acyltransferase family protein [Polyangiaceae bacterium]
MLRFALGLVVGLVVRLWALTWRVRVVGSLGDAPRARVFAFWHGRQMVLLAAPRTRPAVALVSLSKDGQLQHGVQRMLGVRSVRGSSSRGGATALRALVRALKRQGADVLMAVDGPRGPARQAKAGAVRAALRSGALLVPVGSWARRAVVLRGSWDQFVVPLPFTHVVIAIGPAMDVGATEVDRRRLDRAISAQDRRARRASHAHKHGQAEAELGA